MKMKRNTKNTLKLKPSNVGNLLENEFFFFFFTFRIFITFSIESLAQTNKDNKKKNKFI